MTVPTVDGYDVTHAFINQAPAIGQAALYGTGSSSIMATPGDIASRPGCLLIDQSPAITSIDVTLDYFDVESGAVTVAELGTVIPQAIHAFNTGSRPGQRWPGVYVSRSGSPSVSDVANALNAANLANASIGLIIADWNFDRTQAQQEVANSIPGPGNPYPVVGRQYSNQGGGGAYDLDIFSKLWIDKVSGVPTTGTQNKWVFCYRCKGLFYGPGQTTSHCPAGGTHDGTGSYDYSLDYSTQLRFKRT